MTRLPLICGEITRDVIGAFYEVYNVLGFRFLEYAYKLALEMQLLQRGHQVVREACIPVIYKGEVLCEQHVDLLVDGRVVIEVKSSTKLPPTAARQTFNYLRAANLQVGLLLHFGPEPKFYSV